MRPVTGDREVAFGVRLSLTRRAGDDDPARTIDRLREAVVVAAEGRVQLAVSGERSIETTTARVASEREPRLRRLGIRRHGKSGGDDPPPVVDRHACALSLPPRSVSTMPLPEKERSRSPA